LGEVSITINGRRFDIACDDGQEQNLIRLGAFVDSRVSALAASVGQVGDMRLLVLASLMIADELHDATAAREAKTDDTPARQPEPVDENALATALENLCERVESIAARLETP